VSRRPSRRQSNAPTIADVAREAGVSAMTVSRVINGESNVRAETREAVNEAVVRLNYAPNPAARSLAGAGQLRIALLYSNPSAGFLSEYLVGSLEQASRADAQLIVEKCDIGDHELEVTQHLIDRGIDGIVLPPPLNESAALLDLLGKARLPTVLVASGQPPAALMAVSIDNHDAALAMTAHVLALGHRRIGFIGGDANQTASAARLDGYRAALAAGGIAFEAELVAQGLFTYRSGLDAAEQLLELADPPTAIFASNDDMAAATVAVAHRRGLDVPGDLTVCGFDDTTLSTAIWPELTTVHQPIADMARAAVEMLVGAIRRREPVPTEARHRLLDFTLIRRQSDAAPRRRPRSTA
jgi:LacI family transcriptional regulator